MNSYTIMNTSNGEVKIFAKTAEPEAIKQVRNIANSPLGINAHIRMMPDIHAGIGCCIGTTMRYEDKICPNLVGVDIGCGVLATKIAEEPNFEKIDWLCSHILPSGYSVWKDEKVLGQYIDNPFYENFVKKLYCKDFLINKDRLALSMGTLGGGNHYIEINKDHNNDYWVVIHSGSRNLGKQVADFYQNKAKEICQSHHELYKKIAIDTLKIANRQNEIQEFIESLSNDTVTNENLCYLTDGYMEQYLHDASLCAQWAKDNRKTIYNILDKELGLTTSSTIDSVHNYIDCKDKIVRKGSISAKNEELCVIPMNMRDGSLICRGLGNEDWNYSAPHGAGRIMSRTAAKANISLEDYERSMKNIYTTSVCARTIDESPFAYKPMEDIIECIKPTVEIIDRIIPVYNFKAKN